MEKEHLRPLPGENMVLTAAPLPGTLPKGPSSASGVKKTAAQSPRLKAVALAVLMLLSAGPVFADTCRVTGVLSGDTLQVDGCGLGPAVRLAGIDAPEMPTQADRPGQPFCELARLRLAGQVLGKSVSIEGHGRDRHGRSLGVVYAAGTNVNLEMVKAGLAEAYRGKPPAGFDPTPYRQAELDARRAHLGMWVLRDQYFSPYDWRQVYGRQSTQP